jgi:predicted nucleic acid-binding protein
MALPRRAYLDTNLFVHARNGESPRYHPARRCLQQLIFQEVKLNVSALVFDELWWARFRLSYRQLTGLRLTSDDYKNHIEVWRHHWPAVRQINAEILG